jgi:hypothetical protein
VEVTDTILPRYKIYCNRKKFLVQALGIVFTKYYMNFFQS